MPHVKHPVSNPAHGCAQPLHIIGFGLCSKPELKSAHGRALFKHSASVLRGAMPPYCRELCLRTAWSYASVLSGAMPPYCAELCLRTVGSYASILHGAIPPYCRELPLRTAWSYASILHGAIPPYCVEGYRLFIVYGVTVSGLAKEPFFAAFSLVPPPESFVLTSI